MPFKAIQPPNIFKSPAPYSPATRTEGGAMLHISGQVAQDSDGRNIGVGDIRAQADQVVRNIKTIVESQGATLADICRITIFLTAREYLPVVMEVRRQYFQEPYPAATAVIVSGLAHPEWLVEIEATAVLP